MPRVHAIVLAAGLSARLGTHKLLLPAGPGQTVVSRTVSAALAGVDGDVFVVLGRDGHAVRQAILDGCSWLDPVEGQRLHFERNPRFAEGLGSSVAQGVLALWEVAEAADGAMLLLADQPLFGPRRVKELAAAFGSRRAGTLAVAAAFDGRRRNPVVMGPDLLPDLARLSGDEGARRLLERCRDRIETVEFGSGSWSRDIDTWAEYVELAAESGWAQEAPSLPRGDDWDPAAARPMPEHTSMKTAGTRDYLAAMRSAALWALRDSLSRQSPP